MNNQTEKTRSLPAAASGTLSLGGELTVHRVGFGAMRITGDGVWGPPKNPVAAIAVLRRAVELGVNFIDTADSYGPYVSEELIAEALSPYAKDLVIATKGGWNRPGPNQRTHDASQCAASTEATQPSTASQYPSRASASAAIGPWLAKVLPR